MIANRAMNLLLTEKVMGKVIFKIDNSKFDCNSITDRAHFLIDKNSRIQKSSRKKEKEEEKESKYQNGGVFT